MTIGGDFVNLDAHIAPEAGGSVALRLRSGGTEMRAGFAHVAARDFPALEDSAGLFLHPDELRYFSSLTAARRRQSYLLGRYASKKALSPLLGSAHTTTVAILPGSFDQPVVCGTAEPLDVSISHCDGLACAIAFPAGHPMAVDVEQIDPRRAEIMRSQVQPHEFEQVVRRTNSEMVACTVLWTAKEALSKALRCGMTVPLEVLAIETIEDSVWPLVGTFRNFAQYKFLAWVGRGFVLTAVMPLRSTLETEMSLTIGRMGTP